MEPRVEAGIDYTIARRRMVLEQLRARGITERSILEAFMRVPRHAFIDQAVGSKAYADCSFPIGYAQTISQPYTIAFMIQALSVRAADRVLEIGTGSGYQTAILSLLAKEVFSIERLPPLFERAEAALTGLRTGKIRLKMGDGSNGWRMHAPFDRIIVSAAMKEEPSGLLEQLGEEGTLVVPIADRGERLWLFRRTSGRIVKELLAKCAFVPLKKGEA